MKLLNEILYIRCSALGLGFTKPRTTIVIAIMKLYIGLIRLKTAILQLIRHNIEATLLEIGFSKFLYYIETKYRYWIPT